MNKDFLKLTKFSRLKPVWRSFQVKGAENLKALFPNSGQTWGPKAAQHQTDRVGGLARLESCPEWPRTVPMPKPACTLVKVRKERAGE